MKIILSILLAVPLLAQAPIYWFVRSGQSLSRGAVGYCGQVAQPACTQGTTGNVKLSTAYPPVGAFMPLKEITTAGQYVETSATAACNQFTSLSGKRCGTDNYGWVGAPYSQLKKNGTGPQFANSIGIYANALTGGGVAQAKANAAAEGAKFYVPGVYFNQGESEMNGLTSAATYKGYMEQLQADYQTDINAVTGQTGLVPLFIVQKSSWAAWSARRMTPTNTSGGLDGVPIGQLQAALEGYSTGKIFLTQADYATGYIQPNTAHYDGVHKSAAAYRIQGGIEGKVMHQVTVERKGWKPFYPRAITIVGSVVRVRFWVPVGDLAFEETTVPATTNKGFELTDTGGSSRTIVSVALTSGSTDSVDITLSGAPAGTVELRYAWTAAGDANTWANYLNYPRGNVADTDTRTSSAGDSLRDYAVTFRIPGISVAAPFAWEPAEPSLESIAPAKALSNAVTVHNLAAAQTSRTWAVHRYFADKEICGQPQPYRAGAAFTYWQADVTSRWPADGNCAGGYAKTAMIAWEASTDGYSADVVEFRASANGCNLGVPATCTAAGMSSSDMLNFDAGGGTASWGLKVSAITGGITRERSARTMIAAGQYQVLKNGPLFTEVLVREGPQAVTPSTTRATSFGWHCTSGCTAPYDAAAWEENSSFDSIRPTFLVRFYRRWGRVEGDSILQNAWLDRHVDQRLESYEVLHGAGEATSCHTAPAAFVIPARSTVWDGPCWSTDPADATNTRIDLNTGYLIYSGAVPIQDPAMTISAAAIGLELAGSGTTASTIGWNASDKGATTNATLAPHLGYGQWERNAAAGGNGHWITVLPRGSARYVLSMDNSMLEIVMGGGRAYLHFPFSHLGTATTHFYTPGGVSAYGQPVSLVAHPTYTSVFWESVQTQDKPRHPGGTGPEMVQCASSGTGTLTWCSVTSANTINNFGMDGAHMVNPFWVPWLVTGKHFWVEAMQQHANNGASRPPSAEPMTRIQYERFGSVGYVYSTDNMIRDTAWTLRNKALAAVATPDLFASEKAYFSQMVTGSLAIDEGRMGISNGNYPPPDPTNADGRWGCENKSTWLYNDPKWCVGRYLFDAGRSNPIGVPNWFGSDTSRMHCRNCRQDLTHGSMSPWMVSFAAMSYGWITDLGFPAKPMFHSTAKWLIGLAFDSASALGPLSTSIHVPIRHTNGTGYLQSWADVRAALTFNARLGRAFNSTDTTFRLANSNPSGTAYNSVDFYYRTVQYVRIGSETLVMYADTSKTYAMSVDPATDDGSVSSHTFQTGDLVRVQKVGPGGYSLDSAPLTVQDAGSMCLYGAVHCDFYVEVVSPTTLRFFLDEARTQQVNWTAVDAGLYVGQTEVSVGPYYQCWKANSGQNCRGLQGTTAQSHAVGEQFTILGTVMSADQTSPQVSYGAQHYGAYAYAAEHGTTYTDSITGRAMTGTAAFQRWQQFYFARNKMGGGTSCMGLNIMDCDNPQFGYRPRGTPSNVRLVGNSLLYAAPDGAACRYAMSASPFASTDDSSDTASISGPRARSIPLASGAWYYRISCGVTGRVTGQVTAP